MKKLKDVKLFLLDMDGTIYLENQLFDGTLDFLAKLKEEEKKAIYITNNSSRAVSQYIEKLKGLGIETNVDDYCTSANALVYNIKKDNHGAKIFLLGTPFLEEYMEESGFKLVREYYQDADKRPDYVVLAFDMTLTYDKLRIACDYIVDGVTYVATHPDLVCPVANNRFIPDAGSFMECIYATTKQRPSFIAGKPNPDIINMVLEKEKIPKEQVAVVGDRIYTDIMSAKNAGVMSILVLSGESKLEDSKRSDIKADYVFDSIKDILDAIKWKEPLWLTFIVILMVIKEKYIGS